MHLDAEGMRREVDQACWDSRQAFESIGSVEIESKEMSAAVHYRGVSEELGNWVRHTTSMVLQPYHKAWCCKPALAAVEVRPRTAWNRGTAVRHLFVLCGRHRHGGSLCRRRWYGRRSIPGRALRGLSKSG